MKPRWLLPFLLALLNAACTTPVITSDVTSFHDWPPGLQEKTYAFAPDKEQENSLEYRSYEDRVRHELARLGFTETPPSEAKLKATIAWSNTPRDVTVKEPVLLSYPDPFWPHPYWPRYYAPMGGPFYDPFWPAPPVVEWRERTARIFTRQFRFVLTQAATGKTAHETTVVSEGENPSLAAVMPYLIRSAFSGFPGTNGVPRRIELKMEKEGDAPR